MTRVHAGLALRAIAVIIAIAAAIDPAITSNHAAKPEISVVALDSHHDSAQAARARSVLSRTFTVIPAALGSADATVLVGNRVPDHSDLLASPVYALLGEHNGVDVSIESIEAPTSAPLAASVPVVAAVHVTGARGRRLEVTLRAGDLVLDRALRTVSKDDERVDVSLVLVPTAPGAIPLRLSASLADGGSNSNAVATADLMVNVRDTRWAVLFFDPRPSWMSTFVRRAIEADDRFVVTSRVVTSRNISTDAGTPPGRLDDLAALGLFDAVVVGAPDALSESDVSGLDTFLRRRGGSVLLLLDQWTNGPWQRLERSGAGMRDSSRTLLAVATVSGDSAQLRASEIAWPSRLPSGGEPVAHTIGAIASPSTGRNVIWRSAIGAGQLITSGAIDSWRYRDPATSGFDRFWRTLIAEAANAAPPPIVVSLARPVVDTGASIEVTVVLRDPALQFSSSAAGNARATVAAFIESDSLRGSAAIAVPLWPTGNVGSFLGVVRAPSHPGLYRVAVTSGGYRAETSMHVLGHRTAPVSQDDDMLGAWVASRGGRAFPGEQVQQLSDALARALRPTGHPVLWHPMRSGWWIIPFALALSGEWWLRRRRGLS